jgi:eukaryotic-like serine/threonine-protein kinase
MDLLEQLRAALGQRYRVEHELGQGGMAVVLLAEDLKHHRPVAIKLLKPELSAVLGSERFLREIEIAAPLQHPHILPVYDSGEADGLLYYVMPFVDGESLRQRLAREGPLPVADALGIAREVADALQYAHDHGVVHRDIKPENIMLSGGHALVADFGIAKALSAAGVEHLTLSGMVLGTPLYMSPEQISGSAVDGRSDQYSLACTLYEMLTGRPPFSGPSPQAVLARHSIEPVPGVSAAGRAVPPPVEAAIMRAMAKNPAERFASMRGFVRALESSAAETTQPVGAAAGGGAGTKWQRRATAGLAVFALAAGAWWAKAGRTASGPRAVSSAVTAVAVLPFHDSAGSAEGSYLGDGMTEGLIADLAEIGSLKVISRSSGAAAEGAARPLAELARELGVDGVVRGWVRRTGDTVSVGVRLLHAPDSVLLFERDYRTRLGELPDLQREIAGAVTRALGAELQRPERTRLALRRPVDQRAYETYLRGRFHLERGEMDQARLLFEEGGRIAPDWAPPYVGLANYYTSLPFFSDVAPADVLPKARAALVRALELDETLAEAHAVNAYIRAYYEWDWRAAEKEFRRALELRPNYADAYFSYSRFLASRRRFDEAIAQVGRAVELDPLSLALQTNRALLDYFAGKYDAADTQLRAVLRRDSTDALARWGSALVAEQQGRLNDAIAILEPISVTNLNRKASLGHAYGVAGRAARARAVLGQLEARAKGSYVPAYYFALVHAGLGEHDPALRYLERAYEERSTVLAYLPIDPRLAPLRDDVRFRALAERLEGR